MQRFFIILLILTSTLYTQDLEKFSLQLKWKYQFQFAGFIIAYEKGFYKDVGLDVELKEFQRNTKIVKDVIEGKTDFAISDSALIYDALKGKPVRALMAIFQHTPFILLGLKKNNIQTLNDLNAKTIALVDGVDGISIKAMLKTKNINYIPHPPIFSIDKLLSGEVDFMSSYISNEPYFAKQRNINIKIFTPEKYGFEGYGDILFTSEETIKNSPKQVEKFTQASLKGWRYAFSHIDETVELLYEKYNTLGKTKEALQYEANTLKNISGYNDNLGELNSEKIKSIAQQFNLVKNEYNQLERLEKFVYRPNRLEKKKEKNLFTQKELDYIKDKEVINVCYHLDQHPWIMKINGIMKGSSVEFLKYVSKKSNLNFKMIETNTVNEHFEKIKEGICDIAPIILTKPNKFKFLYPTIPFIEDNVVLVTKINEPYVSNLNEVKNKKIAMHRGKTSLIKYVKFLYPNINLVEIDRLDLDRVVSDEFYGYISASYKMSYHIYPRYINKLKIMSKIGKQKVKGSFGITIREPLLLTVFNKSLNEMSELEKQEIENAWVSIEVENQFDYMLLFQILSVFIIILLILINSNIKQKKLHKEIKKLNENLEDSIKKEVQKNREKDKIMLSQSRLAQMGEIISMIAHQWRQPLNDLSLLNQMLLFKYKKELLDEEALAFFETNSHKKIHQMSQTIDDFRDFFKPQKMKTKFYLNDMIHNAIDMVKLGFVNHDITIEVNIKKKYYIVGYENELGQAILNILNNSKDAFLKQNIDNKKVTITILSDKKNTTILISDNAGGIPDNIIDNIFDPYFSTKDKKNGTGLGLYITKIIIEEHMEGKVDVSNNEEGVIFSIKLKT